MIGKEISHYKILEKLGEGGMGVVYKVEDTKLDRFVALKFLPPHLLRDEEGKKRFIQEAKSISALDHPNICTVHEIDETEDGQLFIAMAYYEGETLEQKIARPKPNGQITSKNAEKSSGDAPALPGVSLANAMYYAIQICRGLGRAHEAGIIHRDLKPANIMITTRNEVKILDFGLAKLAGRSKFTQTGATLGTVAYMSPEQVQGLPLDQRTDIWSLGVVFYEMLTGCLPFTGEYDHSLMYQIVNKGPEPIRNYLPDIPEPIIVILDNLLEKESDDRYQSVMDVLADLESARGDLGEVSQTSGKLDSGKKSRKIRRSKRTKKNIGSFILTAVLGILLVVTTVLLIYKFSFKESLEPYNITPFTALPGVETNPSFSPDGKEIAYTWVGEDRMNSDIYVKIIGTSTNQRITSHPGKNYSPAWSPDGRYIAFLRSYQGENSLHLIPARGGPERKIPTTKINIGRVDQNPLNRLAWSGDGKSILISAKDITSRRLCIFSIHLQSNTSEKLSDPPLNSADDYFPSVSPYGKYVAFIRYYAQATSDIFIIDLPGGKLKRLTSDEKEITCLSWSADSKDVVFISNRSGDHHFWRVPAKGGRPQLLPLNAQQTKRFAISPSGNKLAMVERITDQNVWRADLRTGKTEKFIYTTKGESQAIYSPDGQHIVFTSSRTGEERLWICDANGKNERQLTTTTGSSPSWSPDGSRIAYNDVVDKNREILTIDRNGGSPMRLTHNTAGDAVPRWSPDGQWIYFRSNRSGSGEIWKIPASGGNAIQMTRNSAFVGMASPDGKWLYFSKKSHGIWRMPVEGGPETLVTDYPVHSRNWVVKDEGIYFIRETNQGFNVEFFDFKTKNVRELVTEPGTFDNYVSVSPDKKYILYSKKDQYKADIYLVENFR